MNLVHAHPIKDLVSMIIMAGRVKDTNGFNILNILTCNKDFLQGSEVQKACPKGSKQIVEFNTFPEIKNTQGSKILNIRDCSKILNALPVIYT
jgi:hypothetical protein